MYFPGRLDPDSASQLQQALSGHFADGNPPIMAALWRVLLNISPGPAPLLALHVGLYWTGVWALWDAIARKNGRRWFLPLIAAVHPLVIVTLGVILKDTGLAASLIAAFGLLFRQRVLERPVTLGSSIAVGVFLAYAALVRWNGMFAVAPVLIYWIRPAWVRPVRLIAGTAILVAAFVPVSSFVNHNLLGASRSHLEVALELFDIAGIEHFSDDYRSLPMPPRCYTPFYWDRLEWRECGSLFEKVTGASSLGAPDAKTGPVTRTWISAIEAHPLAYAEHRLAFFNSSTYFIVPPALICRSAPEYAAAYCEQPRAKLILSDFVKKNWLYWPCVWLAAGAWLALRREGNPGVKALAWSGTLYGLGYLVVGLGSDWRYHLWTELAISMAVALHFALDSDRIRESKGLFIAVVPVVAVGYVARLLFLLTG